MAVAYQASPNAPSHKSITASSQSAGDIHIATDTSKLMITTIKVETASTNWDMYILQNDNGYSANDAAFPAYRIMGCGNGNLDINLNHAYKDEDDTNEVHLYIQDNIGGNTFDIYIGAFELA